MLFFFFTGTVWVADVRGKNYMSGNCLNVNLTFYPDYTSTRFANTTLPSNATSDVMNQTTVNLIVDVMPGSTLSNHGNKNSTLLTTHAGTVGSTTATPTTTFESRTTATRGTQTTTEEVRPDYEYYEVGYDASCVTCNVVLTEFTLAVVIVQWCMVAVTLCLILCAVAGLVMGKCVGEWLNE